MDNMANILSGDEGVDATKKDKKCRHLPRRKHYS